MLFCFQAPLYCLQPEENQDNKNIFESYASTHLTNYGIKWLMEAEVRQHQYRTVFVFIYEGQCRIADLVDETLQKKGLKGNDNFMIYWIETV